MKKLKIVFAAMFIVVGIASLVSCSSGDSGDSYAGSNIGIGLKDSVGYQSYGCLIEITPQYPNPGETVTVTAVLGKITEISAKKIKSTISSNTITEEELGSVTLNIVEAGKKYTFIMPSGCSVMVYASGTTSE